MDGGLGIAQHENAVAALNAAVACHREGRLDEAEQLYERVLRDEPHDFDALHFLGLLRGRRGAHQDAVALVGQALAENPASAEANNSLGLLLAGAGRHAEAVARFREAVRLKPDFARAYNNCGVALADLGRTDEAVVSYREAVALDPSFAEAHNNLSVALLPDDPAAAVDAACAALMVKPQFPEARFNLGNALMAAGQLEIAVAQFRSALFARPDMVRAHNNLGQALEELNRHDEALAAYEQAIARQPDYVEAQWNAALVRLAMGDFARGWQGYEWRWSYARSGLTRRRLPQPQWQGEDLAGKTILVHAEQGLGDTLQFARYLPLLQARGARVLLEPQPPLLPLLAELQPAPVELLRPGAPLPSFDCHAPLLSLPGLFGTTLATIPASVPYLRAPEEAVARWRDRLGTGRRVGLAWWGAAANRNNGKRSLPLATLAPLLELPGYRFVSLQKDLRAEDRAALATLPAVAPIGERFADFADTAAVVSLLDLVITIDTSIAHLAGALGKPVWLMLPYAGEWRWLIGRQDSPWYPTARLFRQSAPGDWDGVVRRMAVALAMGDGQEARGRAA